MIEDKERGIKIAETREERVLFNFQEQTKTMIKEIEADIKEQEKILKMSPMQIYKKARSGAKNKIAYLKDNLYIQKLLISLNVTTSCK
jgi:hypothetical protein